MPAPGAAGEEVAGRALGDGGTAAAPGTEKTAVTRLDLVILTVNGYIPFTRYS